jgi:tetratricopeptide (TPR) repeat protein
MLAKLPIKLKIIIYAAAVTLSQALSPGDAAACDRVESLALHERALAIDRGRLGAAHPALGRHLHNMAGVAKAQGGRGPALELYQRALELRQSALGPDHPEVALTHNSLGIVYAEAGDVGEARRHYDEALRVMVARAMDQAAVIRDNLAGLEPPPAPPPGPAARTAKPRAAASAARRPEPASGTYLPSPAWP